MVRRTCRYRRNHTNLFVSNNLFAFSGVKLEVDGDRKFDPLLRFPLADADAVIALGAVIRGETSHYDYVCNAVERGCSQVQLEFMKPVVFGVLTTENEEQAFDRLGGKHGHKGKEAAQVAIEMISVLKEIKNNKSSKKNIKKNNKKKK